MLIEPRLRDIGNLHVRRILPFVRRRMVGPFIFFDHMGPAVFEAGTGLDVLPHPHIGLATLTYLFEGEIIHRDSLGFVQPILPGDVNWMTAGLGIVHSERTPSEARTDGSRLDGIQSWVALPVSEEEREPSFQHHSASDLPVIERDGATMRLIAGEAFGSRSPVETYSKMLYLDVDCRHSASVDLPADLDERAVYVADGSVSISGDTYEKGQMLVLEDGLDVTLTINSGARLILLGGAPMDGERHVWWNFVSSSKEQIERAKNNWANARFPEIPGETEFVPLPDFGG